jgi:hypothetical protein
MPQIHILSSIASMKIHISASLIAIILAHILIIIEMIDDSLKMIRHELESYYSLILPLKHSV